MKTLMLMTTMVAGLTSTATYACSICRCGDPTFNALGKEGVAQNGFRVAVDWDRVEKTQGAGDEQESLTENRATLLAAYGFNDDFSLMARVPYSWRSLESRETGELETIRTSGLADPEVYGQARLWSSRFEGDVGIRASLFAVVGVKTPWGENDLERGGERLDEHVQPGTGSTDWFAGLAGSYVIDPASTVFASTQYRRTGGNDVGYHYGNVWLFNVAYDRKLTPRLDAVLELNYRHAGRDEIDSSGVQDPDTGGGIAYVTPRILFDLGSGWIARGSAQVPLSQRSLYGDQREKAVFNLGVTHLLR
jgi:hypothetical protein